MPTKGSQDKSNPKEELGPEHDPLTFLNNYKHYSQTFGISSNRTILRNIENGDTISQLIVIPENEEGVLGPLGCRVLVNAILGDNNRSKYTEFIDIRVVESNIEDIGAKCFARLLSKCNERDHFKVSYLDLTQNDIGPKGCLDIGRSLCCGMNGSLLHLKLDHNKFGSQGLKNLSKGLAMNSTLKRLSLRYCDINGNTTKESLSSILEFKKTELISLDLTGNLLRGNGLMEISNSLAKNNTLQSLLLADNCITETDIDAIQAFSQTISIAATLMQVDLSANAIGDLGGQVIADGLKSNNTIKSFKVDTSLSTDVYNSIFRQEVIEKTVKKKKKTKK
jgi:Ran GTPase-activating protein (RanGAP) involved in mRNA processing and transport